jgi:hypothetical protein
LKERGRILKRGATPLLDTLIAKFVSYTGETVLEEGLELFLGSFNSGWRGV